MPPSRRIIKSPPASPAASEPSQLSLDQDTLLDIAIHVDAALREVHATGGDIDVSFFLTSIDDELEAVNHVFGAYPPGVEVPKYHPILGYLAQVLDSSKDKTKALLSFDFAEVAWLCAANAKSTSNRASVLNQPDLLGLVPRVPHEHRWWLPPARKLSKDATMDRPTFDYDDGEDGEAPESPVSPDAASFFAAASPEPEDVDMANDNDGETPRRRTRLSKRSLAMSPGNDAPVKQRKRVCDPKDACGPCKNKGHECIDQGGAHTFSCVACSNSKIRCDPLNKLVAARKVENDTRDSEAAEKKAADDAACAAKKRAGKKPQDLPKAPKTQGKPSKGRPKKHNMPGASHRF
ncbi:hypothetical protein EI94DRAFT_1744544 [Lactarius quietus]|nr:hypothetical protein EI94DRAFT_1744544 [Lactarius quietus]